MGNGFEIQVTEQEFKAKSHDEQNWILFQGISVVSKGVRNIDEKGCEYSRKRVRVNKLRIATALGAGIAAGAGVIYIVFHLLHHPC